MHNWENDVRLQALDRALRLNSDNGGGCMDDEIVDSAKKFEVYIANTDK